MTQLIECPFCHTGNAAGSNTCVACGGPLGKQDDGPLDLEPRVTVVSQPEPVLQKEKPKFEISDDAKKAAVQADKVYTYGLYTYAVIWRTLAESVSIAIAATIIGLVGGATGMNGWGVLGGVALGTAVGLGYKNYWWVLISAPFGALLGLAVSVVPYALGWFKLPVFIVTISAGTAAVIGSYPKRRRFVNLWEKARPYLGAVGGFVFGIVGMLLGWAVVTMITELMN